MSKGFTLIELLLVVVIIGIVAAFVLPKFGDVKEKAYISAMKNDLRNLATDQEIYFEEYDGYRNDPNTAPTSDGVTFTYLQGPDQDGYVVQASHGKTSVDCALNRDQAGVTGLSLDNGASIDVGVGELQCADN